MSSHSCKSEGSRANQSAVLRKTQAGAALLCGLRACHRLHTGRCCKRYRGLCGPFYTSFRAALGKNTTGTELVHKHKSKEDSTVRQLNRLRDAIARLSYAPATGKEKPLIYVLPICTVVWCGTLPVARTSYPQESVGVSGAEDNGF
jgi:hypothetical protein